MTAAATTMRAFAASAAAREDELARKPVGMTYAQAEVVPDPWTALQTPTDVILAARSRPASRPMCARRDVARVVT